MEHMGIDLNTVYRKAYKGLPTERCVKATFDSEYPDPVSGPFTYYLKPRFIYDKLEDISNVEDPSKSYERLMETYPVLSQHIDSEPDQNVIEADYKDNARTVYQIEICKMKNGITSKKTLARQRVQLPADWGEVPRTTQRAGYRDVRKLATWDLKPKPVVPPKPVLDPNIKEREILKVRTGESEYEVKIGKLGHSIIRDELHGPINDFKSCKIYEALKKSREEREEFRKS